MDDAEQRHQHQRSLAFGSLCHAAVGLGGGRELKGGVILHTEDGGATWKKQYGGNPPD